MNALLYLGFGFLKQSNTLPVPAPPTRPLSDAIPKEKRGRSKANRGRGTMEERVRRIAERLFGVQFRKCRPAWLRNHKTGRNLELDLFSPELKLAIEVDGRQHREHVEAWMDHQGFEEQKWRDREKDILCQKHGIRLIRIDLRSVLIEDVESYLRKQVAGLEGVTL